MLLWTTGIRTLVNWNRSPENTCLSGTGEIIRTSFHCHRFTKLCTMRVQNERQKQDANGYIF